MNAGISVSAPCPMPPHRRVRNRNGKVGINFRPRLDQDVHIAQSHHFHVRALSQPGVEKVAPQINVGLNPNIGLT
jgi:hypothetical protein